MILKLPWAFLLLLPTVAILRWGHKGPDIHAIRFPKSEWLGTLGSKKGLRLLAFVRLLEWVIPLLMVMAIAQPQWIKATVNNTQAGIDIVAVLDTSGSMNAEDFKPKNRMEVAKDTLVSFIKNRKNDRIGLVAFGSDSITKVPLTIDHNLITARVNQTQVGEAGDGTAIGLAVATGVNRLKQSNSPTKVLILITDGVNNAGQIDPVSAAKYAKKSGVKIYAIGIGDKKGAPIPIDHPTYGKRYARHPNGQLILTEFDDQVLIQMSEIAGGRYFNATNTDELKSIYKEIDQMETTEISTLKKYQVLDLFPYMIGMMIVLLVMREGITLGPLNAVRS